MDPTFFELLAADHFPTFVQPAFELFLEKAFPSPSWVCQNRTELFFLLRLLVEHRHLQRDQASFPLKNFGLQYFNLKSPYGLSKLQHILLLIGLIGVPYLRQRIKQYRHGIIHFMDDESSINPIGTGGDDVHIPNAFVAPSQRPISFNKCWDRIHKSEDNNLQFPFTDLMSEKIEINFDTIQNDKSIPTSLASSPQTQHHQSILKPTQFQRLAQHHTDPQPSQQSPSTLLPLQHHASSSSHTDSLVDLSTLKQSDNQQSDNQQSTILSSQLPKQTRDPKQHKPDSRHTLLSHLKAILTNIYSFIKFLLNRIFIASGEWEPYCSDSISAILSSIRSLVCHIKSLGMTSKLYLQVNFPLLQQFLGHWLIIFYPWIHAILDGVDFFSKIRFTLGYSTHWSFWLPFINVGIQRHNPHGSLPLNAQALEALLSNDPPQPNPSSSSFNPFNPLQSRLQGLFSARISSPFAFDSQPTSSLSLLFRLIFGTLGLFQSIFSFSFHHINSLLNWTADHAKILIILALLCKQFIDVLYNQTLRQQQSILEQVSSLNGNNSDDDDGDQISPITHQFFSSIMHVPTNSIDFHTLEAQSPLTLSRLLIGTDSNYPTLVTSQSTTRIRSFPPPQWVSTGAQIELPVNPNANKLYSPTNPTITTSTTPSVTPTFSANTNKDNSSATHPQTAKFIHHSVTKIPKTSLDLLALVSPTQIPNNSTKLKSISTILNNPDQQHLIPLDLLRCQWCNEPPKAIAATITGHCACYKCIVLYVGKFFRCPFSHTPMTLDDVRSVWVNE